ncbi:structural maintenance of chromosomes protein 4 isoform X2 [Anthonomus grandis grandis]|uniref:structural maintenance of chromosomes protein 4 isoform X2 n=1 Tax=Anthonomus grandis grandis TaxID=2921223 RepID=UPI0021669F55|nr:structural maintenance of chromosomes protein 4 isoform X2 [Anthonomus grandis grandis]
MSGNKNVKVKAPVPNPVPMIEDEDSSDEELNLSDDEGVRVDGIYIPPVRKAALTMDPNGPRLVITKIENSFFKSYGKGVVLGPFHKCFNAIVGPNGSGKSNVIDSLLFVFGYRATKIRCKKVSVLLHNSEQLKNIQSCSVTIHFARLIDKEGDDYEFEPGSGFVVSRTAHKDNSSYYELNGKRVQFKEVAILLKKHGVDLDHNRFLILQGEVEQISTMKCKADKEGECGLLEYLEDIIGTSRYKKPLGLINERIEELSDIRSEKINALKRVQNELDELKAPMEEAVGFLKTENNIVKGKNFLYQKNIQQLTETLEIEEVSRGKVAEVEKSYSEKLEALAEKKTEHLTLQDKEATNYEELKQKKDKLQEEFDKSSNKDIQLVEDIKNKNKTRKKTKELIIEEKDKLVKLEKLPEENATKIGYLEKKLQKAIDDKGKYEAEKNILLQSVQQETQGLQLQKEEMQKDLAKLKEAVDKTKSAFNIAETQLQVCISHEKTEKDKLEHLKNIYETSSATIVERTKQVAEIQEKIPATKKSLDAANIELLKVKEEEMNLVNVIRSKRTTLEEGKSSMQASRSSGRVLDSLMRAKREGKCPGLFGRLGDLGAIDAKYDVAVSTACGALDNIVVDTADTAQWCIEFLKKHDIGRAVFIALEKQEYLWDQATTRINTPENVPRLYDLIKVQDERVKTAFYYGLRDTLVANDLDQASRIAYGARRYRVVTLTGDLIETTGTMSGGGKRVLRGRMGQSVAVTNVDPTEIQNLEQEVQRMEQRVRELRQRQAALETKINELQPALRQMQIDLEKYTRELNSLKQQQPNIARQMKEQEVKSKSIKADANQVKKLTKIVEEKKAEYEEAAETAGALQLKVDKLTKEIKEKSTGKIRAVDKNIKDAAKTIESSKSEITKLKVAVKTAERNFIATQENIARMEQDIEDMENSMRAMNEQRKEIEEYAKTIVTELDDITERLKEKTSAFSEVKKIVEQLTKEENKLKSEKIDIDEKLKVHDKKINELKRHMEAWRNKLGTLRLQDIPNESMEELKQFSKDELDERSVDSVEEELQAAEKHLKVAKPNFHAIQEYRKKQIVFTQREGQLEEITKKRSEMRAVFDDLTNRRKSEFMIGYNIIKLKLKEMYQMITMGGDADFEMVDTYNPFSEGIQFNVRPPRKTWKNISNLSGGEKTLSSLALVFALHYYKPSPLYVMDEIDAALDFKNVSIVANYIKERTKNAQFIIISLRSNMFELCDNLVGIYKTYNQTKTVSIDPRVNEKTKKPNAAEQSDSTNNEKENEPSTHGQNAATLTSQGSEVTRRNPHVSHSDQDTVQETPRQSEIPSSQNNIQSQVVGGSSQG